MPFPTYFHKYMLKLFKTQFSLSVLLKSTDNFNALQGKHTRSVVIGGLLA